jgi:hypothetical protein
MDGGAIFAIKAVGIAAGFPLIAAVFGSAVLSRVTDLDDEERFVAGFGVSFAFLGFAQFCGFALHLPPGLCALGLLLLMLLVICIRRPGRSLSSRNSAIKAWPLRLAFGIIYAHLVCIQAILPNYRGGNWAYDWWMHYDEALIFAGHQSPDTVWLGSYTLASRTPLFNLTTASVMSLAGSDFAIFQLASVLPSCVFVLALYLILRDLFDRRAGYFAILLASLNVWMLHNAWFTWPKMLAAHYMLLSLHFYLKSVRYRGMDSRAASRCFLYCVGCAAFGYMTHQVALVYFVPLLLHRGIIVLKNGAFWQRWKQAAAAIMLAVLLIGPWYGWLAMRFGVRQIMANTPATAMDPNATLRLKRVIRWSAVNTVHSFFPNELLAALADKPLTFPTVYRGLTSLYFCSFPGGLTISLTIFLIFAGLLWFWRKVKGLPSAELGQRQPGKDATWAAVWLFTLVGYAGAALLHPSIFGHGIAHSAAFPTAILIAGLAWGVLSRSNRAAVTVVCTGILAEFLLVFWSHWWLLVYQPEVLEDLPGNAALKADTILFLSERLADAQWIFLGETMLMQIVLCGLVARAQRGGWNWPKNHLET